MYEIIEISQPAPSSARIRIMNCPIGAVHSDKEFMYMCVHVFKIASCSIMGVQKSIMPQFTKKPRHYGFQKSHNATVCKPWHYGSHEIHNATVSTLIMPRFAGILWKNCPTLERNKIFKNRVIMTYRPDFALSARPPETARWKLGPSHDSHGTFESFPPLRFSD